MLSLINIKPDLHANEESVDFSWTHPSFKGNGGCCSQNIK